MDKGTGRSQGLIRGPAGAKNNWDCSCLESVPPELLSDVVLCLRVLKGQVKETLSNGGQQILVSQRSVVPTAIHIYGDILLQTFVNISSSLVRLVSADNPADEAGAVWSRKLEAGLILSSNGLSIGDGYICITSIGHCPIEEAIELHKVYVVDGRLHGHPHPVLGGWTIHIQGQC